MLTIFGPKGGGFCDGVNRRGFLRIGTFAMGGAMLNLSDIFRAEAVARANPVAKKGKLGHKALINIFLAGGPPHQDMWDLKTEAPSEIRRDRWARPLPVQHRLEHERPPHPRRQA